MGNITDQFFILTVKFYFFFCIRLQTQSHFLKILTHLTYLIIIFRLYLKIQISFFDISRCFLQLCQWHGNRLINPPDKYSCCNADDNQIHLLYFPCLVRCKHMHSRHCNKSWKYHNQNKCNHQFRFQLHRFALFSFYSSGIIT